MPADATTPNPAPAPEPRTSARPPPESQLLGGAVVALPGWVLGVDGCPGGWVGALVGPGNQLEWLALPDAAAILAVGADVTGVDIPIGLPASSTRAADAAARARLGARASSVFPTPVRACLGAGTHREACERSAAARPDGKMISQQAFHLLPKIADVDSVLSAARQSRVVEVHPEVSLRLLTGRVLAPKKTADGRREREVALSAWLDRPPAGLLRGRAGRARPDDCLDALAVAWTARRWLAGTALVLPEGLDERDERGLRMQIVA